MLADVGPAAADVQLADLAAADNTRLPLPQVDQEAVLERPLGAIDMTEVIDRCAFGVDPGSERLFDTGVERLPLRAGQGAGAS